MSTSCAIISNWQPLAVAQAGRKRAKRYHEPLPLKVVYHSVPLMEKWNRRSGAVAENPERVCWIAVCSATVSKEPTSQAIGAPAIPPDWRNLVNHRLRNL